MFFFCIKKQPHLTLYISTTCQRADWKEHKRSACVKPAIFHKFDRLMKKYSGPNYPMGRLKMLEAAAWEERRRNPKPSTKCDGCFSRFRGVPIDLEEDDYGSPNEDVGDVFKRCTECDYTICEGCSKPENQGEFLDNTVGFFSSSSRLTNLNDLLSGITFFDPPKCTCRCKTSNFGVSYCLSGPCYLDGDGENRYHGDRHPPILGSGYDEDAYELKERPCKTCGVVARCLKKEHLKDVLPGMQ